MPVKGLPAGTGHPRSGPLGQHRGLRSPTSSSSFHSFKIAQAWFSLSGQSQGCPELPYGTESCCRLVVSERGSRRASRLRAAAARASLGDRRDPSPQEAPCGCARAARTCAASAPRTRRPAPPRCSCLRTPRCGPTPPARTPCGRWTAWAGSSSGRCPPAAPLACTGRSWTLHS